MITTLEKAIQVQHTRLSRNKRMFWSKAVLRYLLRNHRNDYQAMKQHVRNEARKRFFNEQEEVEEVA